MGSQPSPNPPTRLAILMVDTPFPRTAAKYTDYAGVFTDLFARATAPPSSLTSSFAITKHDVVAAASDKPDPYPDLGSVDALLVTGGRHSAFRDDPWILRLVEYVSAALATGGRVRVAGICFGHQIVARALGARVGRNPQGWELSVTAVRLTKEGKEVFGVEELKLYQMHRDAVLSTPEGAITLAETDICPLQGMLIPGRALTFQGHPEFHESIVREMLETRHDENVISDELYQSAIARVDDEHDGLPVARAFLKFLRA